MRRSQTRLEKCSVRFRLCNSLTRCVDDEGYLSDVLMGRIPRLASEEVLTSRTGYATPVAKRGELPHRTP